MNKEAIFKEFKKQQEIKKEEKIEDAVIVEKKEETKQSIEKPSYPNSRANRRRKNKTRFSKKNEENKEKEKTIEIVKETPKSDFDKWKEEFLSNDINKEFMQMLEFYRNSNFKIFTDEEFLKIKYEHPSSKVVILDPTVVELSNGRGGNGYIIKPIYAKEYNDFIKNVGLREDHPDEFMKYAIDKCVVYPDMTSLDKDRISAGVTLSLFKYILDYSDLTKQIRVLEV